MAIRTGQVSSVAFLAAAIALYPAFASQPQGAGQPENSPEQQAAAAKVPVIEPDPSVGLLEKGFQRLYELNFDGARVQFLAFQKARPDDPLGKAAEAASYLFEQFNTKGVLTSEFFLTRSF